MNLKTKIGLIVTLMYRYGTCSSVAGTLSC